MKRLIKLMAIALCMMLVLSTALASVFALSMNGVSLAADKDTEKATDQADTKAPLFKDESVYVIANADGSIQKIIVSDWIRNNAKADTIVDTANLDHIENVKGDETFTLNADGMRVWETKGKDLYLKGEGKEPLPVEMKLSYFLDGKLTDPEDLIGKSGEITIRFDYTNNQYEVVEIDGKKEKIYVPFMMMTGMLLDNEKFSDISVTNGKVISDGDRTIVAGIALPGLQQTLGVKRSDIEIPEYFEIKAHTDSFALNSTVTIATNSLLNGLNTKDFDKLSGVKKDLKKLDDAMNQLISGSSTLYNGLATLLEKSSELTTGIDQLYAGAEQLSDGAAQVDDGAGELHSGAEQLSVGAIQLSDGADELAGGAIELDEGSAQVDDGAGQLEGGLETLTDNNDALTQGGDQTFASLLATARKGLVDQGLDVPEMTQDNYEQVLDALIDGLSEDKVREQAEAVARDKVTAAVEANRETVKAAVTDAVRQNVQTQVESAVRAQVTEAVLAAMSYTVDAYNAAVEAGLVDEVTQAQITAAIDNQMAAQETQTTINNLVDQNMKSDQVKAQIDQNTEAQISALIDQNMQGEEVQNGINDAVAKAKAGVKSIQDLKAQLNNYKKFNTGIKSYTKGVESAKNGAKQLKSGTKQLKGGTGQLKSGAGQLSGGAEQLEIGSIQLSEGSGQLKSGTEQLSSGANELKNGIFTLKDGVPALVDGVTKLKNGSMQLSDGLKQFNEQGISKIVKLMDNDLGKVAVRLKAAVDVSKRYKSYSGLTKDMDGEVKFIYKTPDLAKEDK